MKRREIWIGLLVLAVLVAGILLTRARRGSHRPGGDLPIGVDISAADGSMVVDGIVAQITVTPRPAPPLTELLFRFAFTRADAPAEIAGARVSFNMKMNMGSHDFRLVRDGDDWVARDVVLPKCGSGSRLWFGDLEIADATGTHRGRFRLELSPGD